MDSASCLCLGPKNSGKTHLLASLQNPGSITSVSHSVPTIGTNIFRIKISSHKKSTCTTATACSLKQSGTTATCNKQKKATRQNRSLKNTEISILEVGGSMAPMWNNFLGNVSKVLYVVDTSNLCQISSAGVLLYSLLADPRLQRTRILLVLTKMDLAYRQMRNEALLMLQYEKLKKQIRQTIQIVETSSITCDEHKKILDWLALQ